jgi:hypothetical protein
MNDDVFAAVAATCADITCTMKKTNQGPKNMFVVTKFARLPMQQLSLYGYVSKYHMQSGMFVWGE